MLRRPRVFVAGLIDHVYNRAGRGEAPFKLEDEADRFWSLLNEVKKRDGLAVLAWCIMPNHYHLAVRTASVPLWRSIRFLQHAYTQKFNRRCKVLGPLWQARDKARPIQGTDSLPRLLAYVHLNPVTAKIVDDPAKYRWSGHRELLRRTGRPLIDADLVDSFFGGTRRQALHSYLSLLKRERNERWVGGRLEQLPWWTGEPAVEKIGTAWTLWDAAPVRCGSAARRVSSWRGPSRCSVWRSARWRARNGARLCWWRRWRSSVGAWASRRSPTPWARAATG